MRQKFDILEGDDSEVDVSRQETVKLRKPSAPEPLKLLRARARDVVKVAAFEAVFLPRQDGRASVLAST
jgi:hypothetical protein